MEHEGYCGEDIQLTQDERNVIVWAIRMETGAALSNILYRTENRLPVSQDERARADQLRAIWDKMLEAGWDYPTDYTAENYC